MAAGTAAALLPIKSITRKSTNEKFTFRDGANDMGPRSIIIRDYMKGIQQGKRKDVFGWTLPIVDA
jgi:branched-chain amino acid aminotransferase